MPPPTIARPAAAALVSDPCDPGRELASFDGYGWRCVGGGGAGLPGLDHPVIVTASTDSHYSERAVTSP
jgi:hypothetical protein